MLIADSSDAAGDLGPAADRLGGDARPAASLAPEPEQPLVLTTNCLNGSVLHAVFDSVSGSRLHREGAGAVAAFSPSGLRAHAASERSHEAWLDLYQTLGDPAIRLQPPQARP